MATSQTLDCEKRLVGRIIGSKGETINSMQSASGARIQIDQDVPEGAPCKVTVTGQPQQVQTATYIITDCMNGGTCMNAAGVAKFMEQMQQQQQLAQMQQQQMMGMGMPGMGMPGMGYPPQYGYPQPGYGQPPAGAYGQPPAAPQGQGQPTYPWGQ
eukprot:NODE_3722_length_638_cov_364.426146_g2675_i0.p1 GENE.NODE_3722_length_638_cov_364.426146_g2675_i0~~NODE_3722_length_638_cov_364.426146_g2675_i0.p1  ORF type:complete len:156 (-),score=54.01 NODE_3722_length_638_cov_364.426146_g2675_i0:82-549(-)